MYTFDLFRDDRFLVCLGRYTSADRAEVITFDSFIKHGNKPENAGVRWQVRQAVYDSEGDLDHAVVVAEWRKNS